MKQRTFEMVETRGVRLRLMVEGSGPLCVIEQPALFIAGTRDPVLRFMPGVPLSDRMDRGTGICAAR